MKLPRVTERLYHRPWFISPGGYASVMAVVEDAEARDFGTMAGIDLGDLVRSRDPLTIDGDGVARIHVLGTLGRNLSPIEESCGNTSYETVSNEIDAALAENVAGIVFDIDSPGGMASGAGELAEKIASIPAPTATYVSDLCASAAYYLASGTGQIFAEPSATIGSVGVIIPWVDSSAAAELQGLRFDPITNEGADLKGTMAGPSITDAQRAYLQDSVNDLAEQFHAHVSANRPNLSPEVFRAGAYVGARAQELGLSDWRGDYEAARQYVLSVDTNED